MVSDNGVATQADIVGIPGAALSTVSFTQGIMRAISRDNVNHYAVIQVEAIGSCFQSNGPWAAKLPDLLSRAPSVRLARLEAWVGWEKGDTSSLMSQTPGGRTAALLCCALGSLYSKDQCGAILHGLSQDTLPQDCQNASPNQLGRVCMVLDSKLACLGFGNHLALHVTRVRELFFDAGLESPRDLANTPGEEDMHAFLNQVRDALQDENLILQVSGTKCVGTWLALVLAMCPDDVSVLFDGKTIISGRRDNIVFSVTNSPQAATEIHLESKLEPNTTDFRKRHIVEGRNELNQQLSFALDGILPSHLDIFLATAGADPRVSPKLQGAVANLIASMAISFTRRDYYGGSFDLYPAQRFPAQGMWILLGPNYRETIKDRLQKVLCRPSEELQAPVLDYYQTLHSMISTALPPSHCTCGTCTTKDPWNPLVRLKDNTIARDKQKSCTVAQLWSAIGQIANFALLFLFVEASQNSSIKLYAVRNRHDEQFSEFLWNSFNQNSDYYGLDIDNIHRQILNFAGRAVVSDFESPRICSSSGASTIYPGTLEAPRITNPLTVRYKLVDGRLFYRSDSYDVIISVMPEIRTVKKMARQKAKASMTKGPIAVSRLGEHSSLLMTLRPASKDTCEALWLRCQIKRGSSTVDVDFVDIHLGLMSLTPGDPCDHSLSALLDPKDYVKPVKTTSVMAPVAAGKDAIGITLTHRNEESQFLCCTQPVLQLYQGDCCMPCAVAQAEREGYSVVIGGSETTHFMEMVERQVRLRTDRAT